MTRVLYYALGGGHGHALRGLAICTRLPGATLVLPRRLAGWAEALAVPHLAAPEDDLPGFAAALPRPELLVVDVFPRGPTGELQLVLERATRCWLVARRVPSAFYLHPPVRDAIETCYERIAWTEPPEAALAALRVRSLQLPPALLAPDPLPRAGARAALGVHDSARLVLALGSGPAETQFRQQRLLAAIARRTGAALRFVSHELPEVPPEICRLFPAARWLAAADVVVAGGGYHAVHEVHAAGVPAVFVPQRRTHDDQWARVAGRATANSPEELESAVRHALARHASGIESRGTGVLDGPAEAARGARQLVQLLEERLRAAAPRHLGGSSDPTSAEAGAGRSAAGAAAAPATRSR